jgi:hypothetical protein
MTITIPRKCNTIAPVSPDFHAGEGSPHLAPFGWLIGSKSGIHSGK